MPLLPADVRGKPPGELRSPIGEQQNTLSLSNQNSYDCNRLYFLMHPAARHPNTVKNKKIRFSALRLPNASDD